MLTEYSDSANVVLHFLKTCCTIDTFLRILWYLLNLVFFIGSWWFFLKFFMDLLKLPFHDHDRCAFFYFCFPVLSIGWVTKISLIFFCLSINRISVVLVSSVILVILVLMMEFLWCRILNLVGRSWYQTCVIYYNALLLFRVNPPCLSFAQSLAQISISEMAACLWIWIWILGVLMIFPFETDIHYYLFILLILF